MDDARKLTAAPAGQQTVAASTTYGETTEAGRAGAEGCGTPGLAVARVFPTGGGGALARDSTAGGAARFYGVAGVFWDGVRGSERDALLFDRHGVEIPKPWSQQ